MTKHFALIAIIGFGLSACEQRDKGADMAACNLEEMKSNYPDKASLERDFARAPTIDQSREYHKMLKDRRFDFVKFCMRAKGWNVKPETSCLQEYADQANCYIRATDET